MEGLSKNVLIGIVIIIAGAAAVFGVSYLDKNELSPDPTTEENTNSGFLSLEEVSGKAISYINESILKGQATAALLEQAEENGLYKLKVDISGNQFDLYASKDGELLFPEVIKITEIKEEKTTIGSFLATENEVCLENDKPIVYFFGSNTCPYCKWEHPIMEEVAAKFGDKISFHNNMDSSADAEIFSQYSTGGIPTIVLGCKYSKVGAGQSNGEEGEAKIITALICKLTQNQPAEVCAEVQDLIDQVE
ncbi:MAG: thioredoxin family protein [bacterium]